MFLATYTYWVQEERQRRARPVLICGPEGAQDSERGARAEEHILKELGAMKEALHEWMHHNDCYLGRFERTVTIMRATAYLQRRELGRRLIQFIVDVGWDPESSGEKELMSGGFGTSFV